MSHDQEDTRSNLEEALSLVRRRLVLLDAIEERLYRMRDLAERATDNDLADRERACLSSEIRTLEAEVRLLDKEMTPMS